MLLSGTGKGGDRIFAGGVFEQLFGFENRFGFTYDVPASHFALICLPRFLVSRVPEHFTGLCTLTLAVERFILITMPLDAGRLLSKWNRVVAYSVVLGVATSFTVFEASYQFSQRELLKTVQVENVDNPTCMFFPLMGLERQYLSLVSAICLYAVPAAICIGLYGKVAVVLMKRQRNASRNQVLTVALLLSCMFWVILWALAYAIRFADEFVPSLMHELFSCFSGFRNKSYSDYIRRVDLDKAENAIWYFIPSVTPLLAAFSSLMNAACLLIVCKKFRPSVDKILCMRLNMLENIIY